MFQRDIDASQYKCPTCGSPLMGERDLWRCREHGAFFAYGPHLLVRTPQPATRQVDTLMPWESADLRSSR